MSKQESIQSERPTDTDGINIGAPSCLSITI